MNIMHAVLFYMDRNHISAKAESNKVAHETRTGKNQPPGVWGRSIPDYSTNY